MKSQFFRSSSLVVVVFSGCQGKMLDLVPKGSSVFFWPPWGSCKWTLFTWEITRCMADNMCGPNKGKLNLNSFWFPYWFVLGFVFVFFRHFPLNICNSLWSCTISYRIENIIFSLYWMGVCLVFVEIKKKPCVFPLVWCFCFAFFSQRECWPARKMASGHRYF